MVTLTTQKENSPFHVTSLSGMYTCVCTAYGARGESRKVSILDYISNDVDDLSGLRRDDVKVSDFTFRNCVHHAVVGTVNLGSSQLPDNLPTDLRKPTYGFLYPGTLKLIHSNPEYPEKEQSAIWPVFASGDLLSPIYWRADHLDWDYGKTFSSTHTVIRITNEGRSFRSAQVTFELTVNSTDPEENQADLFAQLLSQNAKVTFALDHASDKSLSPGVSGWYRWDSSPIELSTLIRLIENQEHHFDVGAITHVVWEQHSTDEWSRLASKAYASVSLNTGSNGIAYGLDYLRMYEQVERFVSGMLSSDPLTAVANTYLGTHYGWELTVADTKELLKVFNSSISIKDWKLCQAAENGAIYTVYANRDEAITSVVKQILQKLDLALDMSIVWDLTPYSFVVDWILPIGDYLTQLDNYYTVQSEYKPVCVIQTVKNRARYRNSMLDIYDGDLYLESYIRLVSTSLILPSFEESFSPVGALSHSVEAGALLISNLSSSAKLAKRWNSIKNVLFSSRVPSTTYGTLGSYYHNQGLKRTRPKKP